MAPAHALATDQCLPTHARRSRHEANFYRGVEFMPEPPLLELNGFNAPQLRMTLYGRTNTTLSPPELEQCNRLMEHSHDTAIYEFLPIPECGSHE